MLKQNQNLANEAKRQKLKEIARVNGQRIRQLREALNLTQGSFAAKCGVSRTAVPLWESGKASPSQRCWSRMALLAREAPAIDGAWFFGQAGIDLAYLSELLPEFGRISRESEQKAINTAAAMVEASAKGATAIPLLRIPASIDKPISIRAEEIEGWLSLPGEMVGKDPNIIALRISPAFVRPIFGLGDTLIIDTGDRDLMTLHGALTLASYRPNAETKAAAEHMRRGQPGSEYIKEGIWPLLPEGLYLGWLRFDPPAPASGIRPLKLISPRIDDIPSPVLSMLPLISPNEGYDQLKAEARVVIQEPEAVVLGRVLAWIASPKSLRESQAANHAKPQGTGDFVAEQQAELPARRRGVGKQPKPSK
ncbi:MAG: helix-turn-helix transcriptional regulator [Acidobacteria bacterium]|nr:helix-turn-helix transcriptional regulator [Acidobacteriota bacterium]